jgi:hypothetical protein
MGKGWLAMRIHLSKSRVWSGIVVCAAVLGLTRVGPVHAKENVEICHFQPGKGSWKLLSVGQSAVDAHLRNHDDALPGGTTSQTGTRLNADCVEVTVTCPCDYSQVPMTTEFWPSPSVFYSYERTTGLFAHERCVLGGPPESVLVIDTGPAGEGTWDECGEEGVNCVCAIQGLRATPEFGEVRPVGNLEEALACAAAINAYAMELDNVPGFSLRIPGNAPCRIAP